MRHVPRQATFAVIDAGLQKLRGAATNINVLLGRKLPMQLRRDAEHPCGDR